jgi:hypothetical protein
MGGFIIIVWISIPSIDSGISRRRRRWWWWRDNMVGSLCEVILEILAIFFLLAVLIGCIT